ncbi:hypothetical protein PIB30_057625 [Stylosanthes scabra]|uniref:Aminotransferase-like plant mobile domain-containing protein n=1 Tax=Stylosanthes scabra TaxID=79078 RepID=A0ABU6TKB0_9FABA|nr:hypothetical protein [Stylosanthes scabra]
MGCYIFPLAGRWDGYEPLNDHEESRLRTWHGVLNQIRIHGVEWTPYTDPTPQNLIPEWIHEKWHQVDRVVRQLGGLQYIPTAPLNLDEMHVRDGRFGRGEWYPTFLKGWYDMWDAREEAQVPIFPSADLRPSHQYLRWYFRLARLALTPDAPELRQSEDGDLPALNPRVGRRARTRARARGGAPRGRPGDEPPDDPPTPHEHLVDPPSPVHGDSLTLGQPLPTQSTQTPWDTPAGPSSD